MDEPPNPPTPETHSFDLTPDDVYDLSEKELRGYEEAWAKAALAFRTGHRFGHKSGSQRLLPLAQIVEVLNARRQQVEAGDGLAALHAIKLCAEENLPLPTWLAEAYVRAFGTFINSDGKSMSLDEAFAGPSFNSGTRGKVARFKQDWRLGVQLWGEVRKIAQSHEGLNPALKEVLALKKWGVGLTKARELVNMIDETQSGLTAGRIKPLSQTWAKRRKE